MKTILFVFVALSLSSQASAKSCIPGPSNPGGCMGIPDLNVRDTDAERVHEEGRDSGGGGRDSGGGGRDSGGTGDETVYSE